MNLGAANADSLALTARKWGVSLDLVETSRYLVCEICPRVAFIDACDGRGAMQDPRNTPAYRVHRAVSALNSIDIDELSEADREQIAEAKEALQEVSVLQ
jgi:hypothetical protein